MWAFEGLGHFGRKEAGGANEKMGPILKSYRKGENEERRRVPLRER